MAHVSVEVEGIPLVVTEADLSVAARTAAKAARQRSEMLAGEGSASPDEVAAKALLDALPSAIAKRVAAVVPKGFALREIEMQFSIKGEIFGTGLGGQIKAKFAPETPRKS